MANIKIPKDYEKKTMRSVHNRSCIRRSPIHPGLMVPIYSRRVMAGEKVFIDPTTVLQTNALLGPLMGSFTLQLAVFFDSDSNYYGWMDNNSRLSTEEYLNRQRHRDNLYTALSDEKLAAEDGVTLEDWRKSSSGVKKHSILEYAGFPTRTIALGSGSDVDWSPKFDMGFIHTYLNIFRNYYCNNQEENFYWIANPLTSANPFSSTDLSTLDKYFKALRYADDGVDLSQIYSGSDPLKFYSQYYRPSLQYPFGGLVPCTYRPDLLTNLLNSSSSVRSYVRITTSGDEANSFTIDTLRFQNKLQRLIDRLDVSGGRFSNWLRAVWGVKTRKDMDIPELIGVTQKLIDPTELTTKSNSDAITGENIDVKARFVGDLAGNFNKVDRHRGHSFYASTPGRVMVIVTLIPNVDYVQGIDFEITKTSFADDYVPEFAQLGFQNVPLSRYSGLPQFKNNAMSYVDPESVSVGKQVAWLEEMTDVNRNFGEFGWDGLYSYWVLNRLFSRVSRPSQIDRTDFLPEISQYINPLDWQYPFVAQTITDPNWFLQVGLKIKCVRPIGKRYMPNLE